MRILANSWPMPLLQPVTTAVGMFKILASAGGTESSLLQYLYIQDALKLHVLVLLHHHLLSQPGITAFLRLNVGQSGFDHDTGRGPNTKILACMYFHVIATPEEWHYFIDCRSTRILPKSIRLFGYRVAIANYLRKRSPLRSYPRTDVSTGRRPGT
jgi:hypothetical protein